MNGVDVGVAFLEGLALIASPCILPVLPLILSASIDGGKARPFGIIAGFVVAFSAFVLLSRQIVEALHINTDAIRYVSLVLLFILGLVLLFDKLSELFSQWTQSAADFGSKFGTNAKGGFGSGLVIGALIGFVWTPCAGPILAAVLVQVIRQQTSAESIFVTIAFALGAGIPMFVIALMGRKILARFGFFTTHTRAIRKIFAVLILASVVYLGLGSQASALLQGSAEPSKVENASTFEKALDQPYPAPNFVGISEWLNSPPLTIDQLKGKVVLVDFWTYSCINCIRTLPFITSWDKKYRDKGLVIVGVHAPEFEFEKDISNIKSALTHYGIEYPVAVDNNLETWVNYHNQYWPAHYLIDQNGQVVYTHFGEGDYDVTENNIRYLLGLKTKAEAAVATPKITDQTPETYLGYARAERYQGTPSLQHDHTATYTLADDLTEHHWSLGGEWKVEGQKIISQDAGSTLDLTFISRKVFLVLGTSDNTPQKITLTLDGKPLGQNGGSDAQESSVTVDGHKLYELINQNVGQGGKIQIKASTKGLEVYAFTFGT